MTVQELINELNNIEDKSLDVRVLENNIDNTNYNMENYWINRIEVANTGQSGYELHGEVILIGEE
jgi:tRNA A-37 threonylcarbamoyl transferase component Bud32